MSDCCWRERWKALFVRHEALWSTLLLSMLAVAAVLGAVGTLLLFGVGGTIHTPMHYCLF